MNPLRRWWVKAGVQGVVSLLPARASEAVNGRLQTLGSGTAALSATTVAHKLEQADHHIAVWEEFNGKDVERPRVLEIGTGWFPVVPLILYAYGAERVESYDVRQLTSPANIRAAAGAVAALRETFPARAIATRLGHLETLAAGSDIDAAEQLREMRISFMSGHFRESTVAPGSFDLAVSDNTLEHVPVRQLEHLCGAMRSAVGIGGVVDHFVDASDHYAHFDRSIGEYHFLRWDRLSWRLINNRLHYQNRLRQSDYVALFERCGVSVVRSEWSAGRPEDLIGLPLAAEFRGRSISELSPLRGFVTGTVSPGASQGPRL
jgi:hypothetical protein